jgi:hypothetical protein
MEGIDQKVQWCNERRLEVGLNLAKRLGATHAILTGKADPFQETKKDLSSLIKITRNFVPLIDIHTNGLVLHSKSRSLDLAALADEGLTMATFSIASFDPAINRQLMGVPQYPEELIEKALQCGLLARCSLVMNKEGVGDLKGVMDYVRSAAMLGAHMVVVREIWIPELCGEYSEAVYRWNVDNKVPIGPIEDAFKNIAADPTNEYCLQQRDPLPWGTPVFVAGGAFTGGNGINITFARCDEASSGPIIKSVVLKPNGHGYRNWDHEGDILY